MALRKMQKIWLYEYKKCGNATEAARIAGYKHPNKQGPENLVKLGEYLRGYEEVIETANIADMTEINEFWTSVMRDEYAETKDRLKASELRAKVQGAFIDKVQHSGSVAINNPFAELTSDELKKLVRDG